ncbi:MAG: hypothetical protein ACTS4T_00970 [Candidatus Hodgkinia cicadicola]
MVWRDVNLSFHPADEVFSFLKYFISFKLIFKSIIVNKFSLSHFLWLIFGSYAKVKYISRRSFANVLR